MPVGPVVNSEQLYRNTVAKMKKCMKSSTYVQIGVSNFDGFVTGKIIRMYDSANSALFVMPNSTDDGKKPTGEWRIDIRRWNDGNVLSFNIGDVLSVEEVKERVVTKKEAAKAGPLTQTAPKSTEKSMKSGS